MTLREWCLVLEREVVFDVAEEIHHDSDHHDDLQDDLDVVAHLLHVDLEKNKNKVTTYVDQADLRANLLKSN